MAFSSAVFLLVVSTVAAAPPMVKLRNGVEMPSIAAGTWQYNDTQAYASIKAALSVGFNMVDTAFDYHNQEGVGRAIAEVPRKSVFLETKVPGCLMDKSMMNPLKCYEDTKKDLAADLELLKVDYVDLVIIHFPPAPGGHWSGSCGRLSCKMVRDQWKAMEEFYSDGKARAIGVSNYCPSCFECLEGTAIFPMVNQVQYHLGMGVDPQGLMSYGAKKGVVTQGYSVLGNTGGHASPEISKGKLTTEIGAAHNRSTVQVALKWVVANGVAAVTKSSNPEHLKADLDLWSWNFAQSELAALNEKKDPAGKPSFACTSAEEIESKKAIVV